MARDKSKYIPKFVEESKDHIEKLNSGLLHLEKNPQDREALNEVFRAAHSIKGGSKMLGLEEVMVVTHNIEDILDAMRSKEITFSDELFTLLFRAIDMVSGMLAVLGSGGVIEIDTAEICESLEQAAKGGSAKEIKGAAKGEKKGGVEKEDKATDGTPKHGKERASEPAAPVEPPQKEGAQKVPALTSETIRINTDKLDEAIKLIGEMTSNHSRLRQNFTDLEKISKTSKKYFELVSGALNSKGDSADGASEKIRSMAAFLFTQLKLLSAKTRDDMNYHNFMMDDLRDKVLQMRMLPISTILNSFPRLIRDLTSQTGKKAELVIEGGETELDKKVIEQIKDPLMHLIRNCVDHGIESPEERSAAGKSEKGTIYIRAGYEGGNVAIQVSDDGGGIPLEKVKEKAVKKGLIDQERADSACESELINLIFSPGFSTSAMITDVSGRGVGMDVVRENVTEHLKGDLKVESQKGNGTTVSIRLPPTLAIMRVLVFEVGGAKYAIAINFINEILRLSKDEIINVVGKKAFRLRKKLIPVTELKNVLRLPAPETCEKNNSVILLLSIGDEKLGVIIDDLLSEENMEIKPLPSHMQNLELVSGATLSGKNEIIMLLNVPKILDFAKEIKEEKIAQKAVKKQVKSTRILVVDDSINTREIEQSILEAYGYSVDVASDGMEALEKSRNTKYDLIVTDVEMPRLDGFSLTEKLRSSEDYSHTPIIIVTSRDKEEDKRRGLKVGADAYIVKGTFDQNNLLETVQYLVD